MTPPHFSGAKGRKFESCRVYSGQPSKTYNLRECVTDLIGIAVSVGYFEDAPRNRHF